MTDEGRRERQRGHQRRYAEANRAQLLEAGRLYREANLEKVRAGGRRYYAANAEKQRAYRKANRAKLRETQRRWRAANPEKVRAQNKKSRQWAIARPEKARAYAKRAYEANPEKGRERARLSRVADPEKVRQTNRECKRRRYEADPGQRLDANQARRTQKLAVFVEHVDRSALYDRDEGHCGICYAKVDPDDFHVDHVIPLARGGEHSYDNTQIAHPKCNLSKGARLAA